MAAKKKIENLVEEQADAVDGEPETVEVATEPIHEEPTQDAPKFRVIVAQEGDSYPSIAAQYCPEGVKQRVFAQELLTLNNGKQIRPGVSVTVKVA